MTEHLRSRDSVEKANPTGGRAHLGPTRPRVQNTSGTQRVAETDGPTRKAERSCEQTLGKRPACPWTRGARRPNQRPGMGPPAAPWLRDSVQPCTAPALLTGRQVARPPQETVWQHLSLSSVLTRRDSTPRHGHQRRRRLYQEPGGSIAEARGRAVQLHVPRPPAPGPPRSRPHDAQPSARPRPRQRPGCGMERGPPTLTLVHTAHRLHHPKSFQPPRSHLSTQVYTRLHCRQPCYCCWPLDWLPVWSQQGTR